MKIGLDFDGVVIDQPKLRSFGAKIICKKEIPPSMFKKETVLGENLLTREEYDNILTRIHEETYFLPYMELVSGFIEYASRLIREGENLKIITARGLKGADLARQFLKQYNVSIPISWVNRGSKIYECSDREVYIDDNFKILESLVDAVPNLFLLDWWYNRDTIMNPTIIRVDSWRDYYRHIQKIKDKGI